VTQEPVNGFWWSKEGVYLYYETADHRLWQYNPAGGEMIDITSQAPVYGQPLSSLLSRIPDGVPEDHIYFAPSGTQALFAVVTYSFEEGTPDPSVADWEIVPSGSTSEVWYLSEEELEPRWLGTLRGTAQSATWSQDESRVLLKLVGCVLSPCGGDTGWLIAPQEGQMWELFPATAAEPPTLESFQIAPDGEGAFFCRCIYSRDQYECEYGVRTLGEGGMYHDEPVHMPLEGQPAWLLPNNRGLLVTDRILIYLYGFDGSWRQLNNTSPPYTWGSVPMDPPGETTGVIKFSSNAHYMAWNGYRGLQVFSLCPGGGELLECE